MRCDYTEFTLTAAPHRKTSAPVQRRKLMQTSCLPYRLTEEERRTFNETGLLQIENALSPSK
jgi:hypothetical protein